MSVKRKGITKSDLVRAIKDIGERQDKIISFLTTLEKKINLVDNVLGGYVKFNKHEEELKEFFNEQKKKDEEKAKQDNAKNKVSDEEE